MERRVYTCNVCGNLNFWTDDHTHIERPVGTGYNIGEEYFVACSDGCRKNSRTHFINWLGSKPGWSKKSAQKNFDETIAKQIEPC